MADGVSRSTRRLVDHVSQALGAARASQLRIMFVPHRRTSPGDYDTWACPPTQEVTRKGQVFAAGAWGGEFHPDFQPSEGELCVYEHWSAGGFDNTDLDFLLKQHHVSRIVLIGMRANTCMDTTARFAQELGFHVTLVKDAIAAFRPSTATVFGVTGCQGGRWSGCGWDVG
ncbi:isochorismatase family cysteine hydrolase [Streptomyces sp900116325]|uniref:cysteine hydrolase family protein n=1 Tax=Streptomyces sp. 900116325 TaxID=3154295 RepID=UPI0033AF2F82